MSGPRAPRARSPHSDREGAGLSGTGGLSQAARRAVVGLGGPFLRPEEAELFARLPPAGVILFARNVVDPAQLRALTDALRLVVPDIHILVDQEGGRVARLRPPHWPAWPPCGALDSAEAARAQGLGIGRACASVGIDVVCAPVLDRPVPGADAVIGDRAFRGDVGAQGLAMAEGLLEAGVTPVAKHAPGHGRATVDSHAALPRLPGLDEDDLSPFRACAHLPWMMTAHIVYESLDPARPATLSPVVIREAIRGAIGFRGTLITDDLMMGALQGTPAERAAAAIEAGCDLAMHCSGELGDMRAVLEAVA